MTIRRALQIGHALAQRAPLSIPDPEEVARDPSAMARFLVAFAGREERFRDEPEPEPDWKLYEARSYYGVSIADEPVLMPPLPAGVAHYFSVEISDVENIRGTYGNLPPDGEEVTTRSGEHFATYSIHAARDSLRANTWVFVYIFAHNCANAADAADLIMLSWRR